MRAGSLDAIFVTGAGGAPMESVEAVEAVAGGGLRGDRYSEHRGHWSPLDECQVTLVAAETLDEIETTFGVSVHAGEHRRNLVTRGLDLMNLYGRTFTIGDAVLAFDRPRPPCRYIASITEPGMTRALGPVAAGSALGSSPRV
jgi:MOSC domain-containing protein YiiM